MSLASLRNPLEWALMVALVFGAGAIAHAQNEDAATEGRIVKISPSDGAATTDAVEHHATDVTPLPDAPKHWIGILGGPVTPELRAHLDIPEGQGLLIRQVVPDSPAIKAGLEKFDVLLRANDTDLHEMRDTP
jgi:S1-C subfamily serine protease